MKNCDLSEAIDLDVDFSKYTTDDTTKLPIREDENLSCKVLKVYKNGEFAVCQFWSNEDKEIVKQQVHRFSYFFDFVAFLKGDLSGADLLFCTGMKNLSKGVIVDVLDGVVCVDLALNLKYGYEIPATCKNVQEKVKTAIENMTGLEVSDVNVAIAGVNMEQTK